MCLQTRKRTREQYEADRSVAEPLPPRLPLTPPLTSGSRSSRASVCVFTGAVFCYSNGNLQTVEDQESSSSEAGDDYVPTWHKSKLAIEITQYRVCLSVIVI